jgi:hypothetical protein
MGAVSRLGSVLVGAVSLAGCLGSSDDDDDDGNGSCAEVQGCGGDVVGVWEIVDTCAALAPPANQTGCAANVTYGEVDAAGQFEFTADGQVITNINLTMHATFNFTEACLTEQTGNQVTLDDQATCDALATGARQAEGVTSVTCTLSGRACVCPATFESANEGMGTWMASGTNLIDEDGTVLPYCVSSDTLTFGGQTEAGAVTYVLRRVP